MSRGWLSPAPITLSPGIMGAITPEHPSFSDLSLGPWCPEARGRRLDSYEDILGSTLGWWHWMEKAGVNLR